MGAFEQLKDLWEKIQNNKRVYDWFYYFEDMSGILFDNCIYKFSDAVLVFGEKRAFELDDLFNWYDEFKEVYQYLLDNDVRMD